MDPDVRAIRRNSSRRSDLPDYLEGSRLPIYRYAAKRPGSQAGAYRLCPLQLGTIERCIRLEQAA